MCKICLINEPFGTLFEWNTKKWWCCVQFIPRWQHFPFRSWTEAQPCPILTSDWPCQTSLFHRSFWWLGGKSSQLCSVLSCGNELVPEGSNKMVTHIVPLSTRKYAHTHSSYKTAKVTAMQLKYALWNKIASNEGPAVSHTQEPYTVRNIHAYLQVILRVPVRVKYNASISCS